MRTGKAYAIVLGVLATGFFLGVMGQAMVFFLQVDFLPPMGEWYDPDQSDWYRHYKQMFADVS